eukprot:CAMPEP_0118633386 /NCGR_PEP_ID=MMETSP0785-20121206/968_1 /TAXON_ID=91992 /ORGANISM="Bolidomonas pacifica, Strain CCMP 1866" /LENGTH=385 /DNA_ID=CAMNT_0006524255 /DNA_START=114 /DNA_END=1268 /DNA_ORIENTATION=+
MSAEPSPSLKLKIDHPRDYDVFLFRDVEFMYSITSENFRAVPPSTFASLELQLCLSLKGETLFLEAPCIDLREEYLHFKFPKNFSNGDLIAVSILLRQGNSLVAETSVSVYVRPYEISTKPHLTSSDLIPFSSGPPPSFPPAYFTLLTNDSYLPGVIALHQSLLKAKSKYDLHIIIPAYANQDDEASSITVSPSTLETLSAHSIQVHPVSTGLASQLPPGSMAPLLNQTQWLKLELWSLTSFSRILYLDADTIITANVDELLESPALTKFTCVGDYFAGSVFLVFPSITLFNELSSKCLLGGKYLYGEQDFLNDFFRRDNATNEETRQVLAPYNYHCMAEDFGYPELLRNPTMTCKIVEFASCNRDNTPGVRWKPWMDPALLGDG